MFNSKVKHSFHVFLTSLMANDLLYLIFAFLHCILAFLPYFDLGSVFRAIYPVAVRLKGIQCTLFNISVFIKAFMSLERLSCVSFPLRTRTRIYRKCSLFLILVGIVLNILVVIPVIVLHETPKVSENTTLFATTFF